MNVEVLSALYDAFSSACSLLVTMGAAAGVVYAVFRKANKPNDLQNERIKKLEERADKHDEKMKEYDSFFRQDKTRLDGLDDSMVVMMGGMLALMKHALNGNDVDALKKSQEDLEKFLLRK